MNDTRELTHIDTTLLPDFNRLPISQRAPAAQKKYSEAVNMYASSKLTLKEVADICGVTPGGLSSHIRRHHRLLLLDRYGLNADSLEVINLKVKAPKGQSLRTHLKYKDAIEACGDIAYIEYNVSEVARLFGLEGVPLSAQLYAHYPDVIPARERLRERLGIADNTPRGMRPESLETYRYALELYTSNDLTIPEVARRCNVSEGGFKQFLRFYRKDVVAAKEKRRKIVREELSAQRRVKPASADTPDAVAVKYAPAIASLLENPRSVTAVAAEFGFNPDVFREYLKAHAPQLASQLGMTRLPSGKVVKKAASLKYDAAIREFASSSDDLKTIALRHGVAYKSLCSFINRNCPEAKESHLKAVNNEKNKF